MKRLLAILMILAIALLSGCGGGADRAAGPTPAPTETPVATAEPIPDAPLPSSEEARESDPGFYDVDLAGMGATMVYSYVFSIVSDPAQYVGQRFRVRGAYDITYWSATGLNYNFIVVADATACCAQGLEFVLNDGLSYPAEGDQIEITGTFGTYEELGETYYYIQADSVRSWE